MPNIDSLHESIRVEKGDESERQGKVIGMRDVLKVLDYLDTGYCGRVIKSQYFLNCLSNQLENMGLEKLCSDIKESEKEFIVNRVQSKPYEMENQYNTYILICYYLKH